MVIIKFRKFAISPEDSLTISTKQRAKSNGVIVAFSVLGSASGLLLVGYMTDLFDNYGHAFAIIAAGPLLAALLVMTKFPETARV